ncbi:MAG: sigma-54 interaction domain-containing protein, partial [Bdellovibrionales bacterium]
TGKELVAQAIHEKSNRAHKPFVAINCGALRETLLESELFGHEKGAFTGAYAQKIGLAEVANGGTLFLDEIGELSAGIQSKLLRFLQEGEIYRVGGKEPIKVDIRLVSATNRDLEKEVQEGSFREDLYYRINTIVVNAPPLRKRKEDIGALVDYFLTTGAHRYLNRGLKISDEALEVLLKYDWPGNIRELQNVCERLQILSESEVVQIPDLPDFVKTPEEKLFIDDYDPAVTLHELERRYILKALNHFEGNKTQAANALGVTIKTLYNKLHEYGEFNKFAIHSRTN